MKTLYLLRHAKSDWTDPRLPDHDRPLNPRGQKAAATMANYWAVRKGGPPRPDRVLCSTAVRARATLDIVSAVWKDDLPAVDFERGLYLCGEEALLDRLKALGEETGAVLMVGHNPDFQLLARDLCDRGDSVLRAALAEKLPTCSFVEISIPAPTAWRDLRWGLATLTGLTRPRDLAP
ncbi:SixA phosphatase family protein [Niveispirillum fermenti]|uniref:SixA phosphatase family protein n=1 Tax=Niveispirillum fermenti TaxID=1233113 RepID=UPI003A861F83